MTVSQLRSEFFLPTLTRIFRSAVPIVRLGILLGHSHWKTSVDLVGHNAQIVILSLSLFHHTLSSPCRIEHGLKVSNSKHITDPMPLY